MEIKDVKRMGDMELLRALLGPQTALKHCYRSLYEIFEATGVDDRPHRKLLVARELVMRLLRQEMGRRDVLSTPSTVKDYLRLVFRKAEREVFVVVFLDAQNRTIASEELFHGTLTQTSVYPREIVKEALRYNAAAVIFAHNHPSGVAEPSHADEMLTRALREALALVDVKVLDHIVVAGNAVTSFAERGLL